MLAEPPDESAPLRRALSGQAPARTLLVPMVIRDRLAGIVCADELPGEEGRLNEAAVEVLTFVTGLAVDLLAARKKIPSPSLTPTGETIPRFEPPPPATMRAAVAPTSRSRPPPTVSPARRPPLRPVRRRPDRRRRARGRPTPARPCARSRKSAKTRIPQGLRSFSSDPGLTSAIPNDRGARARLPPRLRSRHSPALPP